MKNNLIDEIILNYNPYVLNKGINLFEGDYFEQELQLDKVIQEKEGIIQVWFKVKKEKRGDRGKNGFTEFEITLKTTL